MEKEFATLTKLIKKIRTLAPNDRFFSDEKFNIVDDFLYSPDEVKEIVAEKSMSLTQFPDGTELVGEVDSYVIDATSSLLWNYADDGIILRPYAEVFGELLQHIIWIAIQFDKWFIEQEEYLNEVAQLERLLKSQPRRIVCRTDNKHGLSCAITSEYLMGKLLDICKDVPKPMVHKDRLTTLLGEIVYLYEGFANLITRNEGKVASYVLLGDLIYLWTGLAPNPDKWSDCNPKEKYDIVKGWVKQYEKHKSVISD